MEGTIQLDKMVAETSVHRGKRPSKYATRKALIITREQKEIIKRA